MLAAQITASESFYNQKLARCWGGKIETKLYYRGDDFVRVDIETETHVIEAGLDKRSSLDSIHQVGFFHLLKPQKRPLIIIYDTDGREGKYEYQIRKVSRLFGIAYLSVPTSTLNQNICPTF